MTSYILQIIAFQLVFLLLYELVLKKETFFQWNRWYLLLTPLIALFLPFIKVPVLQSIIPQSVQVSLPEITLGTASSAAQNSVVATNLSFSTLEIIFLSGMVISSLLFLRKLYKIIQLKRNGKEILFKSTTIIYLPNRKDAFSFAGIIFLGENLSTQSKKHIFAHEMVHVKQKHYLDLLYFEILRIIFWFNPMVYLYQKRIATLHEYIADAKVVAQTNKTTYYQNLLSEVFQTQTVSFINTFFNHSLIKKRIVMLQKSKSETKQLFKFAFLVPIFIVFLTVSSCEQNQTNNSEIEGINNSEEIETPQKEDFSDVPFAVIDQVPIYPGCENLTTNEERKKCMSEKIDYFVAENFNTNINENNKLSGRQRITVQFKIDKNGNVADVISRAPAPFLEKEAIRVINLLPKMKAGMQDGKEVGVLYSLPIIFQMEE